MFSVVNLLYFHTRSFDNDVMFCSFSVRFRIILLNTELKPYDDPVDVYILVSYFVILFNFCILTYSRFYVSQNSKLVCHLLLSFL